MKVFFSYADITLLEKLRPVSVVVRSQCFLPDFRLFKCFEDDCRVCDHALNVQQG